MRGKGRAEAAPAPTAMVVFVESVCRLACLPSRISITHQVSVNVGVSLAMQEDTTTVACLAPVSEV